MTQYHLQETGGYNTSGGQNKERTMAEIGMQAKDEEQEDDVRARLHQLAEEELGETEKVESHRKQSLSLMLVLKVRDSTLSEMKRWLRSQV